MNAATEPVTPLPQRALNTSAGGPGRPLSARGMALIIASAMFMEQLDGTVVTTALPAMAKSFHADPTYMSITLTAYLLSLALFIPASGQIADRLGAKTVFRVAIVVFTLGSAACALADSVLVLVLARIVQGIGGAMMVPVGRLILLRSTDKTERIAAMAWLLTPAMVGPVLGPPIGGLIVTYASWRWIFIINIPIGVLGIVLVSLFIQEVKAPVAPRFDFFGFVCSGVALCCLVAGLQMTTARGSSATAVTAVLLVSVAAAAMYGRHALRHDDAILDLRLMRIQTFSTAVIAGTLFRIGFGAMPFLLPLMLQLGFGMSAAKSGLITFASAASSMMMKSATVKLLRLFGFRSTLIWNTLFCFAFLALCAAFRPSWPLPAIYVILIIGGGFRSLQFTAYGSIAYADVTPARLSAATSFYSTVQQLSSTLGVAISAAVLTGTLKLSGHARPGLMDFSVAFLVVALLSLPALLFCMRLPKTAGSELTARPAA